MPIDAPDPALDLPDISLDESSVNVSKPTYSPYLPTDPSDKVAESDVAVRSNVNDGNPSTPTTIDSHVSPTKSPDSSLVPVDSMQIQPQPNTVTLSRQPGSSRPRVNEKWFVNPKFVKLSDANISE